jgi:hypothetical protein
MGTLIASRSIRRLSRFMAGAGLAAWVIGSVLSVAYGTPEMFQRFGSLGVAAAVLFFTDRLTKIELSRQRSVEKLLHEYGVELEAMKAGTDPKEIPDRGYVIDFLTEEREFDKLRATADRFSLANIVLLTLSTLQWGFGEMIFETIAPGGTSS